MDYYDVKLPTMHAVWIRLLFAFSAAFIVSLIAGKLKSNSKPILPTKKTIYHLCFLEHFRSSDGCYTFFIAIQKLEVAVAQTIFALLPLFVLPISLIVYKEKITIQSVFACLLALSGVLLLIWRNEF
jgi:drug/metabolite transporter (DMT)-like permease